MTFVSAEASITLDGVDYATFIERDASWRMGSANPQWLEELIAAGSSPAPERIAALREKEIWLSRALKSPPLAVMCCGLGSAWPGMGRELYDNFPAARAAMDEIAAISEWDVLSLLDQRNIEKISQIRWQIPYLFLLEYAQWSQLASLGLQPALFCGHSLGELVALCLAGVYSSRSAWYLLDTRAMHMARLEEAAASESGMLAISAERAVIDDILSQWPELGIANINTEHQYVLSGPRPALMAARKSLRRRRIPAMTLNIGLAFHNPAMRILRNLAMRRLSGLDLFKASVPMLSCVHLDSYPAKSAEISAYIADLDENTVAWPATVSVMRDKYGIRHFLELGPQETLCGITSDIDPTLTCMAVSRKGHEAASMRNLCARLFAAGYLKWDLIARQKSLRAEPFKINGKETKIPEESAEAAPAWSGPDSVEARKVINLIARASGTEADSIRPEQDLRHDLGLRSSSFPLLLQNAEQELGKTIELENIIQLTTVSDILRLMLGITATEPADEGVERTFPPPAPAKPDLRRFGVAQDGSLAPALLAPVPDAMTLPEVAVVCSTEYDFSPGLWRSLCASGVTLAVPESWANKCAKELEDVKAQVLSFADPDDDQEWATTLDSILASKSRTDIFFLGPKHGKDWDEREQQLLKICAACVGTKGRLVVIGRSTLTPAAEPDATLHALAEQESALAKETQPVAPNTPLKSILWQNHGAGIVETASDLLIEELNSPARRVVWMSWQTNFPAFSKYCGASPAFNFIWPDPDPSAQGSRELFQGAIQFSRFALPMLDGHGNFEVSRKTPPVMPLPLELVPLMESSRLLCPALLPIGLADLEFGDPPALPAGVTRECRVQSKAIMWLPQDGATSRLCRTELSVRRIRPNGRHLDIWDSAVSGVCALAASPPPAPPIWDKIPDRNEISAPAQLYNFYQRLHYAPHWRLISDYQPAFSASGEPGWRLELTPLKSLIAISGEYDYAVFLHSTEALLQGAQLSIFLEDRLPFSFNAAATGDAIWRVASIGFVRFDLNALAKGSSIALIRPTWLAPDKRRFDAQCWNDEQEVALTLQNLELTRIIPQTGD